MKLFAPKLTLVHDTKLPESDTILTKMKRPASEILLVNIMVITS